MTSHKKIGGLQLSVSSPLRFKKRPSAFNVCVGKQLKGKAGPTNGGRYDKIWQGQFTAAVRGCAGRPKIAVEEKKEEKPVGLGIFQ